MTDLAHLERRIAAAERRHGEARRRRNAVARFEQERTAALADPTITPLKRLRLTHDGGMSQRALAILAGISRDAVSRAERDPSAVSAATLRRLASALRVSVSEIDARP